MNAVVRNTRDDVSSEATQLWTNVREDGCFDGELQFLPECLEWLEKLALHVRARLGQAPRIQMYAYRHGGATLLAVDCQSVINANCVSLTIQLCNTVLRLNGPADDQFDIAVPGVVYAITIVSSLCLRSRDVTNRPPSSDRHVLVVPDI